MGAVLVDPSISGETQSRGSKGSRGREQRSKEGTGFASDNKWQQVSLRQDLQVEIQGAVKVRWLRESYSHVRERFAKVCFRKKLAKESFKAQNPHYMYLLSGSTR